MKLFVAAYKKDITEDIQKYKNYMSPEVIQYLETYTKYGIDIRKEMKETTISATKLIKKMEPWGDTSFVDETKIYDKVQEGKNNVVPFAVADGKKYTWENHNGERPAYRVYILEPVIEDRTTYLLDGYIIGSYTDNSDFTYLVDENGMITEATVSETELYTIREGI